MTTEIAAKVKGFITQNFYVPEDFELKNDSSLLDQGVVDSTGVLEVVSFLEEEFEIEVDDDELVPENLDSIDRIAAFVGRKKS